MFENIRVPLLEYLSTGFLPTSWDGAVTSEATTPGETTERVSPEVGTKRLRNLLKAGFYGSEKLHLERLKLNIALSCSVSLNTSIIQI